MGTCARSVSFTHFLSLVGPPASVTLTNSPNKLNFVAGEGVTFSCSSTGGNPTPTLELLRSGVVVDSSTDGTTTLEDTFPAWGEMDGAPIVCWAIKSAGQKDTTKTITVNSECVGREKIEYLKIYLSSPFLSA